PALLLRSAQAHPHEVRTGTVDARGNLRKLRFGQLTIRRGEGADDLEAVEFGLQPSAQLFGHARRPTVEKVSDPKPGGQPAHFLHQRWSVHPAHLRPAAELPKPHERHPVRGDVARGIEDLAEVRISDAFDQAVDARRAYIARPESGRGPVAQVTMVRATSASDAVLTLTPRMSSREC